MNTSPGFRKNVRGPTRTSLRPRCVSTTQSIIHDPIVVLVSFVPAVDRSHRMGLQIVFVSIINNNNNK
jgi:hypothetical protein